MRMAQRIGLPDDGERLLDDLETLAGLVDDSLPGWTRSALTDLDVDGRHWVLARMREAGLDAHIDAAGNVIGVLAGNGSGRGRIMTGSHTDTVLSGGRFDGNVGVASALEVARSLRASGTTLAHDLVVIDFFNEEVNPHGLSCVGSRALTGALTPAHLAARNQEGTAFGDALGGARVDPNRMHEAAMDLSDVIAYVELHVEQGPNLEAQGTQIGLVTDITGVAPFRSLFTGRQDHAGTTPMSVRRDAGCAAAGTVLAVETIASEQETSRGTSGSITFTPDAVNVINETAEVWGEFRSPDGEWIAHARERLAQAAEAEGAKRGVGVELEWLPSEEPVPMSEPLLGIAGEVVADLGLSHSRLYSGAGHDAAFMALQVPTAMVFVPSQGGRSHCPEEFTESADILAGAEVLLNTIVEISVRHAVR
ncbi:Zn-dependent hydrolase [Brevibacterium album]|uniref:Zn-dependent hydrolase n=1 Tax=Brevibacterium album TaxID=417948 RepID=UPI00040A40C4|nr:Zn-dependent hydrolase [Brevibacterium album]